MKYWIAAAALAGFSSWAQADGLQSLEQFLKNSQAGEASFTQTVTSPAKEGQAPRAAIHRHYSLLFILYSFSVSPPPNS